MITNDIDLTISTVLAGMLTASTLMSLMIVKYGIDNRRTDPQPPKLAMIQYAMTSLSAIMAALLWVEVVQRLILYAVSAANIIEKLNDPSIHALKDMTI